jgi:predicted LPLAT superfamily acyltransferase
MRARCDKLFYLIFDCIPRERALRLFSIGNKDVLDRAVAEGRGVHVAVSHHGSIHIAGLLMALTGYRVAGVRDRHESAIRRYVQRRLDLKYPEFQRARVLYADSYPREIFRCYQENYILASAMDVSRVRLPNQKTEMVTIFGEERPFLSGPLHIAYRCRAPILQGFIVPGHNFCYRFDFVGELAPLDPGGDEQRVVRDAVQAYAANVERYLRETPSLCARV